MLARGDRVLVACSGGPDSVALLDALDRLRRRLGVTLEVAAVDHGLRPEAAAECEWVRAFAESRGLATHVLRARLARRSQEAAREARLALLEGCARERGCARVALGHTRGDQAETVIMRLVRGAGARGLAGIPPVRGVFIRPLLDVGRVEIEAYVARRRLPIVRDPSNEDRRYLRVRVRREILPLLARENPRVEEALARLAANLREERGETVTPPLSRAHLRAIAQACEAPGGTRRLDLGEGRVAEIRVVRASRRDEAASAHPTGRAAPAPVEVVVPGPGRHAIPPLGVTLALEAGGEGTMFRAEALRFPLVARTRRPGDRIRLEAGTRKVSDVLIDAKVPRGERDRVLLLCDGVAGARVLWIAGIRQAAGTRATGGEVIAARIESSG